jgi:hypothetical protein
VGVAELLGGGVVRRAHAHPLAGAVGVADLVLQEAGQAQVEDLHPPVGGQQQVGGLEVAVDQAPLVGVLQRQRRLVAVVGRPSRRNPAALLEHAGQAVALDVLHDQEVAAVVLLAVVGLDDARWDSLARARASRWKRATASGSWTLSGGRTLMATWRSGRGGQGA